MLPPWEHIRVVDEALEADPGATVDDIADETGLSEYAVAEALAWLKRHEWVIVTEDEPEDKS